MDENALNFLKELMANQEPPTEEELEEMKEKDDRIQVILDSIAVWPHLDLVNYVQGCIYPELIDMNVEELDNQVEIYTGNKYERKS